MPPVIGFLAAWAGLIVLFLAAWVGINRAIDSAIRRDARRRNQAHPWDKGGRR